MTENEVFLLLLEMGKLRGKKVAMKKDIENGGKISRYLEEWDFGTAYL